MTFVDQNAMFNNTVDAFIHSGSLPSTKASVNFP